MTAPRNRLLATLPAESLARLAPALEPVALPARTVLAEPHGGTRFVHFLEGGLVSAVATSRNGDRVMEVGQIGFEGMTGHHVLLGADRSPIHGLVQVAGSALRLPAARLREAARADAALREHLLRFVHAYHVQLAYSALANGRYTIPERLARWLLMCHDRIGTDAMALTHEFFALMLGVRRAGVTAELHFLEGERAVRARRGVVEVRDRAKLERMAGDTYGVAEAEYEAAFGRFRAAGAPSAPTLSGKRILLVEDDFDLAMQMRRHLAGQGAEVIGPAPAITEALRLLLATRDLDVAVLDLNLRGEMAFPLAEALRKRGVPFVFVSAYGQAIVPSQFAHVGFLDKPVEPGVLAKALLSVA